MGIFDFLFRHAPEDPDIALLTESDNDVEAELILGLLKENGLPCMAKDKKAGSAVRLYAGFSTVGCAIYVRREDLAEARALLGIIRSEEAPSQDGDAESDEETNSTGTTSGDE